MGAVEELRLFGLCRNMKWTHLPNAGGLYDQDPVLLDKFEYIFSRIAEHEAAEAEKRNKETTKNSKLGRSGAAGPKSVRVRNK